MKWTVTTPPTVALWDVPTVKLALRIDTTEEDTLIAGKVAAATAYAELAMGTSLLPQTITATFYNPPEPLYLPQGPVTGIVSVVDANGNTVDPSRYKLRAKGHADYLYMTGSWAAGLSVVYTTGYASAAAVPADIREAVLAHTGTLYANRESAIDSALVPVPHSLQDFYRLRSRHPFVG